MNPPGDNVDEPPVTNRTGRPGSWTRVDTSIAALILGYVVASARTAISWDSHLYLASAKSLFWSEMSYWYHWIREPLYPLQVRASTALFGSSDLGLVAIQATLAVIAVSFLVTTWFGHAPVMRRLALILIMANPIVIGIVGFVGQQALFFIVMALGLSWAVILARSARGERQPPRGTTAISGVLGASLSLASAVLMPVALALGGHVILDARRARSSPGSSSESRQLAMRAGIVMLVGASLALAMWWGFKAAVTSSADRAYGYPVWAWEYAGDERQPFSVREKVMALLSLGPDGTIPPSAVAWELTVYGGLEEPFSNRCGYVTEGDISSTYAAGYVETSCRPAWADRINGSLTYAGLALHRLAMLGLVAAVVAGVLIARLRLVTVTVVAFVLPYLVGGLGISRYAVPLYPLGVCVLLGVAMLIGEAMRDPRGRRV